MLASSSVLGGVCRQTGYVVRDWLDFALPRPPGETPPFPPRWAPRELPRALHCLCGPKLTTSYGFAVGRLLLPGSQ